MEIKVIALNKYKVNIATSQLTNFRSAFVFRNPKRSTTIQTYLRPLSKYVWVLTTLAAFLIIVAMKFALRIEKIIEYYEVYAEISWSFIVLTTIGTFCQQGKYLVPTLLLSNYPHKLQKL